MRYIIDIIRRFVGDNLARYAVCILIALCSLSAHCQATKGEKTLSLEAGWAEYNSSGLAGIEFTYRFSEHFRLAPSVDYVFRHQGIDALSINLNCHFPFAVSRSMDLFPLVGVNFAGWNNHHEAEAGDVSTRVNRIGLNAGAGWGIHLGERLRLAVTANYVFIKNFNGTEVMAKIGYAF